MTIQQLMNDLIKTHEQMLKEDLWLLRYYTAEYVRDLLCNIQYANDICEHLTDSQCLDIYRKVITRKRSQALSTFLNDECLGKYIRYKNPVEILVEDYIREFNDLMEYATIYDIEETGYANI